MKEKISVIVPAYNSELYLERCVKSIQKQSYRNIEIIIVENASIDKTGELSKQMAINDHRIKVIHEEKAGVSHARNRGMEEATGEYFSFVDADDWIHEEMLERLYSALYENQCDMAGCRIRAVEDERIAYGVSDVELCEEKIISGKDFVEQRLFCGDTSCCPKLFSRNIVGNTRYAESLTIGEDMLFLLEVMQKDARLIDLNFEGYFYFQNCSGAMQTSFKSSYMDQIRCWQEAKKRIAYPKPEISDRANCVILISVMLVAGKLALAKEMDKRDKKKYMDHCLYTIKELDRNAYRGAYRKLSGSYKLRVSIFRYMPHIYMRLWRMLKRIHAN